MDLSTITDTTQLKALAYDLLQAIELQQSNLRVVQQRINELQQEEETKKEQTQAHSEKKK